MDTIGAALEPANSLHAARSRMSRHVAGYIRDLIVSGQMKPGERLRLEPLARALDASTTPIREALLLLETEGLVKSEPRRGFYVLSLSPRDIEDIFDVHAVIAGRLAERAARQLTETQLNELAELDISIRLAVERGQPETVEQLNYAFHRIINRAAGSPMLAQLLGRTTQYVPRRFYAEIHGWLQASAEEHAAIVEALRQSDGNLARSLVERHIRDSGTLLVEHLRSIGFWGDADESNSLESVRD